MLIKLLLICIVVFSIQAYSAQTRNPRTSAPVDTGVLYQRCLAEKQQLEKQKTDLEDKYKNLQNRLAELNRSAEASKSKEAELANLKGQITSLNAKVNELSQKLLSANQSVDQLSRENTDLKLKLDTANQNLTGLTTENTEIKKKLGEADLKIADLSKSAVSPQNLNISPAKAIASMQEAQNQLNQTRQAEVIELPGDQGVRVIRELVIGTLELYYDKRVKAETPVTLKAIFKAHPMLNSQKGEAGTEPVVWHIKLDYDSPVGKVNYDKHGSGGQGEDREVNPYGGEEKWIWVITFPKNFQNDNQEVNVFVSYQTVKEGDKPIASQGVTFEVETVAKETWNLIKENLNYILGVLAAILGLWATYVTVKKNRVETKLAQLKLNTPN